MQTVIFSDTHLTTRFEQDKFIFLKSIIEPADRVIINGDFWEGRQISFNAFIESRWSLLFPLLKKRNTIYLFGNHDEKHLSDERCHIFSDEQKYEHIIMLKNNTLFIEHGHNLNLRYKKITYSKLGKAIAKSVFISKQLENIERFSLKKHQKPLFVKSGRRLNKKIKVLVHDQLEKDMIYVCGHTHVAEADTDEMFLNIGSIQHGKGEYLLIQDDVFFLKQCWYG